MTKPSPFSIQGRFSRFFRIMASKKTDFGRIPKTFHLLVRTKSIADNFFSLKITLIVCFCSDSTHAFILSEPKLFTIFIRGMSILLFSFINKVEFLVSKGLLCLYNKQNNTWLLVDMEFLFEFEVDCSRVRAANEWNVELNAYLRAPMYYSPCNLIKGSTSTPTGSDFSFARDIQTVNTIIDR